MRNGLMASASFAHLLGRAPKAAKAEDQVGDSTTDDREDEDDLVQGDDESDEDFEQRKKDRIEDEKKDDKKEEKIGDTTDFGIELESADGAVGLPLSRFGALLPPFKVRFTKLSFMDNFAYEKSSEPVFQTFELPLSDFKADPARLRTIRLKFDRTQMRVIILSQVGFEDR